MQEIWKDALGLKGYQVSNLGNVKSLNYKRCGRERVLRLQLSHNGYYTVCLGKKRYRVNRLVWEAFNGPIPEGMQVNHINEVRTDNRLENLNLMTQSENLRWGDRIEKLRERGIEFSRDGKWVVKLNTNNEILHFYPSIRQAERETGIKNTNIVACLKGRTKSAGGFIWKYAS